MKKGKVICKVLKDIRRRIAEENDINLDIPECTFKGECRGTCPRCEAELRFLDVQLRNRRRTGRAVKIAGIAAGTFAFLTPFMLSCSSETVKKESNTHDGLEVAKERNKIPEKVKEVVPQEEPVSEEKSTFDNFEDVYIWSAVGEIGNEREKDLESDYIIDALEGEVPYNCRTEPEPIDYNAIHKFSGNVQEVIMKGSTIFTEPLSGVCVVNLRTNQIVSSDQLGGFEINLKLGDVLRMTAPGFETEDHSVTDLNQKLFIFTHNKEIKEMMNESPE